MSQKELGSKAGQQIVAPPEKMGANMFRIKPPLWGMLALERQKNNVSNNWRPTYTWYRGIMFKQTSAEVSAQDSMTNATPATIE